MDEHLKDTLILMLGVVLVHLVLILGLTLIFD